MEFLKPFKRRASSIIHMGARQLELLLKTRHHERKRKGGRISTRLAWALLLCHSLTSYRLWERELFIETLIFMSISTN